MNFIKLLICKFFGHDYDTRGLYYTTRPGTRIPCNRCAHVGILNEKNIKEFVKDDHDKQG